jgi:hypothetical protein
MESITLIENIQAIALQPCTRWNPFCAAKIVRQLPASLSELDRIGLYSTRHPNEPLYNCQPEAAKWPMSDL